MEYHIGAFYDYFEQNEAQNALYEALEAELLAQRLRDNNALYTIEIYITLTRDVIRGNELFDDGQYEQARTVYSYVLNDVYMLTILNYDFIVDLVESADGRIHFYDLIEQADNIISQDSQEHESLTHALSLYNEALSLATALPFEDGIELATESIEYTEELIFLVRFAEATELESQGIMHFLNGDYLKAIAHLLDAYEIYYELGETLRVAAVLARINTAEHNIEEQYRLAAEEEQRRLDEEQLRLEEEQRRQEEQNAQSPDSSDDDPDRVLSNYEHNRSIYFDMRTPIDRQGQPPASLVRMGGREGMNEGWYNGCGWIAAYNALLILDNPMHPAEIVDHFETRGGTVLDGMFGTFPHAIERLFVELGYSVNHRIFPQVRHNLDNEIRNSRVAILAYMHTSAAHFIVIEYRPEDGRFIVYNDSFARRRSTALGLENASDHGAVIDSVNALIRETPEMLFSFSLITID